MNLDIFLLIFVGYFADIAHSGGHDGKDVHFKIVLPIYKHTHKHTHTVYKKPKEEKKIVIHNHHHKHEHGHGHGHEHEHKHSHGHKHKHEHSHKHKDGEHEYGHRYFHDWNSEVEPFKEEKPSKASLKNYGLVPTIVQKKSKNYNIGFDDDGYLKSHKSLRTESFHLTEKKNPATKNPIKNRYLIGNYKVVENESDDFSNNQYDEVFRSPLSNKKYSYQQAKNPYNSDEESGYAEEHELYHKNDDDGYYDYLKSASLVDYEIALLEQLYHHF